MFLIEPEGESWRVRGGVRGYRSGWRGQQGSSSCGQMVGDRGGWIRTGCGGGIRERRVDPGLLFESWRLTGYER